VSFLRKIELERLSLSHRWALTILLILLCLLASGHVLSHGNPASAVLLFAPLLVLFTVWVGWESAGILGLLIAAFCLLVLIPSTGDNVGWSVFSVGLLLLNGVYVFRYARNDEERAVRTGALLEENEAVLVGLKDDLEKVRSTYSVDQIKIQRYRALNELARNLAMVFKTSDVVTLLIETISKTFMAPGGVYSLLLYDSTHSKALHAVRYSVDTEMETRLNRSRLDPAEPYNAWVAANAKALFMNDAHRDFRFENYSPSSGLHSLIAAPMVAGHEMLGLIRIESPQPDVFRQDDARLLSNFVDLGTVALEQAGLYRQTVEMAITDGLTGLYVQRYYKERVRDEVLRAREYGLSLCLMMMDVDNFKSYNDTYGHLVGDKVLRSIAKVLKDTVRAVDLVARYGGEEFSVLLPKTGWDGACTVAERIRQRVEELEIPVVDQITRVTISIGVAEYEMAFGEADAFIDSADRALYRAKNEGKNRVCRWESTGGGVS
jgi:diguanylate cyclase (GGDEF)-like protein